MAINPVDAIPDKLPRPVSSQKDIILKDVKDAIAQNISQFEFIDDRYRYGTLAVNAEKAVKLWYSKEVFTPVIDAVKKRLSSYPSEDDYESLFSLLRAKMFFSSIQFVTRNFEDRTHVYCVLDMNTFKNTEQAVYENALSELKKCKKKEV